MPSNQKEPGRFGGASRSATFNLILGINGLKLEPCGVYTVDLAVDGVHQGSLPLYSDPVPGDA